MRWLFKLNFYLLCLTILTLSYLPVMSSYISDGESWDAIIRGFHLLHFSAWGIVPLLAPLLLPIILFGHQSAIGKEISLTLLLIGNSVCYVHAFNKAKEWLLALEGSFLTNHLGAVLFPSAFTVMLIFSLIWISRKNATTQSE